MLLLFHSYISGACYEDQVCLFNLPWQSSSFHSPFLLTLAVMMRTMRKIAGKTTARPTAVTLEFYTSQRAFKLRGNTTPHMTSTRNTKKHSTSVIQKQLNRSNTRDKLASNTTTQHNDPRTQDNTTTLTKQLGTTQPNTASSLNSKPSQRVGQPASQPCQKGPPACRTK